MHKIFYNLCPSYLNFVLIKDVYQYNTRSNMYNFLVSHCHGVDNSTSSYTGINTLVGSHILGTVFLDIWCWFMWKQNRYALVLTPFLLVFVKDMAIQAYSTSVVPYIRRLVL